MRESPSVKQIVVYRGGYLFLIYVLTDIQIYRYTHKKGLNYHEKGECVMKNQLKVQLSLFDPGFSVAEDGNIVTPTGVVITKPFLMQCLKYRSDEEIAEDVLGISVQQFGDLLIGYNVSREGVVRFSPARLKIMEVTQRYLENHGELPQVKYIKKRTGYTIEQIEKELLFLKRKGYIKYSKQKGIQDLLRAV